jgi:hypothetical protein
MPRKKKEENTASSQPADDSKPAKPAKKVSKLSSAAKKETVKKDSAKTTAKTSRVAGLFKKKTVETEKTSVLKTASSKIVPGMKPTFKHLPRQGETQLVAFVRDPQCAFTYWEVTPQRIEEVKRELQGEFHNSQMVLRLFTVEANGEWILVDEIRVEPGQINRYVELKQTGGTYILEIAQKTESGRYITYAQSNPLSTFVPVGGPADENRPLDVNDEMPEEMLNYYFEQGYDVDDTPATQFISSADRHKNVGSEKRLKRKKAHYSASFI